MLINMKLIEAFKSAGQVAVRKKVGGGSFVCGLKRIVTQQDTVECHAAIGESPEPCHSIQYCKLDLSKTLQLQPPLPADLPMLDSQITWWQCTSVILACIGRGRGAEQGYRILTTRITDICRKETQRNTNKQEHVCLFH